MCTMNGRGCCHLCEPSDEFIDDISEHLLAYHPSVAETLDRWPDGKLVILDDSYATVEDIDYGR